jgi:hypothetical protein
VALSGALRFLQRGSPFQLLYSVTILITTAGIVLIGLALVDIFQTLFHPAGRGAMSDWSAKLAWRVFRQVAARISRVLTYAGPAAILLIIISWAAFIWFGFALIYLPQLSKGFGYAQTPPNAHHGLVQAMGLSLGTLITLTEGSYAKVYWLQFARGAEAVIGFGLLTASVSWLLSIYPVLESRRAIAQRATLLHHAERENRLDLIGDAPERAQDWVFALGADLASLRNQMAQFPITYYFDMGEPETALAGALSYLLELADRASAAQLAGMKIAGTVLGGAVESFLEMLASDFLSMSTNDKHAILRAYASEQMSDLILQKRTIPYPRRKAS